MPEWENEKYICDNCDYDGPGWYLNIVMRGFKPMCLCEECAEGMKVEQEN